MVVTRNVLKKAVYGLIYRNCVQKLEVVLLDLVLSHFGAMSISNISGVNTHHCSHSHLKKLHLIYTRIIDDSLKFLIQNNNTRDLISFPLRTNENVCLLQ